jgi:hypothetical protein
MGRRFAPLGYRAAVHLQGLRQAGCRRPAALRAGADGNRCIKFAEPRPYSDPEKAARRLVEIASTIESVQDGRIHVEKINGPFLFEDKASPAEYAAGMKLAIERGWLLMHESGTFVRFTPKGAEMFA